MPMRRSTLEVRKSLGTLWPCDYGERPPPPPIFPPTETPILASGGDDSGFGRLPCLSISGEW